MERVICHGGRVIPKRKEEFVKSFPESDGKMLAGESRLRRVGEGVQEAWFCSGDKGNSGGPLELEFLEYWRQEYPQVPIESLEEKKKRFACFGKTRTDSTLDPEKGENYGKR